MLPYETIFTFCSLCNTLLNNNNILTVECNEFGSQWNAHMPPCDGVNKCFILVFQLLQGDTDIIRVYLWLCFVHTVIYSIDAIVLWFNNVAKMQRFLTKGRCSRQENSHPYLFSLLDCCYLASKVVHAVFFPDCWLLSGLVGSTSP